MRTAIDMIGTKFGSGTKTYNLNFCENLNKIDLKNKIYIFITKEYISLIPDSKNKNVHYIVRPNFLKHIFFRIIWMQFFLPIELKFLKIEQLFSPMNMGPIILKFLNIRFILALHSNLPWVYFSKMPGNILRNLITKFLMEISVRVCDKLIVDSDFAKNEIIQKLNLKKEKVFSIYLGVDENHLAKKKNEYYIKNFDYKNYIISVLSCVRYHDIIGLLKGFKLFQDQNKTNLKFVFILQILDEGYFKEIKEFIRIKFKKNEIIFYHNLDNKFLVNLYRNAKFYIFSSYCEVFGLTSLEAMSQSCPVIISKNSALSEINSDAAEYFNPKNENEVKDSMYRVFFNDDYRKKLIDNGKINLKRFSWKNTITQTLKILDI